jgi:hypothetical protein
MVWARSFWRTFAAFKYQVPLATVPIENMYEVWMEKEHCGWRHEVQDSTWLSFIILLALTMFDDDRDLFR